VGEGNNSILEAIDMIARMERKAKRKKKKMVREKKERLLKKKGKFYKYFSWFSHSALLSESVPMGLFEGDVGAEGNYFISTL